jgi:hypothetical protein
MTVLAVTLKPGQEPHPPHRHAEEEFLILAEGTGTWHLDGKEIPARKGDVAYAAPGVMHGVKNTGDGPLTYYMVKWAGKGVKAPEQPFSEPKAGEKKRDDKPPAVVGTWEVTARHATQASLFQLRHGVRKRTSAVRFEQVGDRITGHATSTEHDDKDEPVVFRTLRFADDRLVFEYDIQGWAPTAGPIAVERRQLPNKGTLRAEARLTGDRLVGTWGLFTTDGTEVFRGEWEAVRAMDAGKR